MVKDMVKNGKSLYELYQMLKEKYGSKFDCDPYSVMDGNIRGFLVGKMINITYRPDDFLLISTESTTREVLDELIPILKEVMWNFGPICSYDLKIDGREETTTIEWDVKDPKGRLKDIINGRTFPSNAKMSNLKLFGPRKVEDYLESDQEKKDIIKNARIYGIDPGSIQDVEAINNLSEVNLYFAIDALGGYIWRCRHDMAHKRIPKINLTEEEYAIEYMVYQTKKFGVELPEPAIDKHIVPTPSYNAWYRFYSNHFKNVLTGEQWDALQEAQRTEQDISAFMPSGSWTDLLENTEKPATRSLK